VHRTHKRMHSRQRLRTDTGRCAVSTVLESAPTDQSRIKHTQRAHFSPPATPPTSSGRIVCRREDNTMKHTVEAHGAEHNDRERRRAQDQCQAANSDLIRRPPQIDARWKQGKQTQQAMGPKTHPQQGSKTARSATPANHTSRFNRLKAESSR
jgi:hypothetical protein